MAQFKYEEITKKIIGAAMKVHSALGNGFQEVIYQRALEIEFSKWGLGFVREFPMPIFMMANRSEKDGWIFLVKG
jgi:GxxExxY protein